MEKRTLEARKGLYFEEFEAGQTITSAGRTITEADVVAFAALSGDWSAIHSDVEYAAQGPFGRRIAHGLLGLSIANGLAVRLGFLEDTVVAFRGLNDWKFSLPIFPGDTIRARITIAGTKAVPRLRGGMVTLWVEVLNQNDQVVQQGTWTVLVKGREQRDPGS
ncbi:MAG TPA: MaoC/PaaZ C-terminal domain-containing protein [Anaerolineaceae bacterium]|nr:MaoC/PaaZ C-terminal domain-containing protein [Anaerolineaceae bacterium]